MNITLAPSGAFALTLPSGRTITIPNTPHASEFLYKILYDAEHSVKDQRGYIGAYPTQAIADAWMRKAAERERVLADQAEFMEAARVERQARLEAELGISVAELEIEL